MEKDEIGWKILAAVAEGIENFEMIARKPNATLVLGVSGSREMTILKERQRISRALYRLKKRRYLEQQAENGRLAYRLTLSGEMFLARKKSAPTLPQGQMFIVSFDIPEKFSKTRQKFRRSLRALHFQRIQLSVWVSDRDWTQIIPRWIGSNGLAPWVRYFVAREVGRVDAMTV